MKIYKNYWLYFFISAFFLVPSIVALIFFGLQSGIDFTGGSLLTLQANEASMSALLTEDAIRAQISDDFNLSSVKENDQQQILLRLAPLQNAQKDELVNQISENITEVEVVSFDSLGATLGGELIKKTLIAIVLACIILVFYLWNRFHDFTFGIAALLGVIHDTLIVCGIFSLLGAYAGTEVDTLFVTALLTTISFSVHDTVVIYDRIRELKNKFKQTNLTEVAEAAVTATFSRSLNNSLTVVFMLLALLLLGGVTLRDFALALLLGVICGTYSSPFASVPLLLFFDDLKKFKGKKRD
ncbi:MAG: protein translocase subunit SecF [bacterium]|nr:protein translocase subunit SecF [bacterium]